MARNDSLLAARFNRNDEYYTQLSDIKKELKHYKSFFAGKVVYCNCDNYKESNFFRYFLSSFKALGLKRLYSCHFTYSGVAYALSVELGASGELVTKRAALKGGGDFRSHESVDILMKSDVVVSNPPFSLFREYVAQLTEYDKKFLVLGSINAIAYKGIFPLIKDNRIWLGYNLGGMTFRIPDHYEGGPSVELLPNGSRVQKFGNICWFTNIESSRVIKDLPLTVPYQPSIHRSYENYDAINVDRVCDIPKDFYGVMGVPITFLGKFNHEQFTILGINSGVDQSRDGIYGRASVLDGKETYTRIFITRCSGQSSESSSS